MKLLKQEEFKSGQVVLFEYKGKTHEGIVEVEGKKIFICQDVRNGAPCKNKHGKKFSYALCNDDGSGFLFSGECKLKSIRLKPKSVKKGKSVEKAVEPVYRDREADKGNRYGRDVPGVHEREQSRAG